jgi:hypothetical protein
MENLLERLLEPGEVVHHKDGNGKNNLPDNLELMTNGEHTSLHHKPARSPVKLMCHTCGKEFYREVRNYTSAFLKGRTKFYCSKGCNPPPPVRVPTGVIPHGTKVGYSYHKCRCPLCKEANRIAANEYRSKKRALGQSG